MLMSLDRSFFGRSKGNINGDFVKNKCISKKLAVQLSYKGALTHGVPKAPSRPEKVGTRKKHVFHIPHVVLDEIWGVNKIRKLYLESYTVKQLCTRLGWFRFPKILKFTRDKPFSNNNWPVHWEKAKTFKKRRLREVIEPFSFITNSCNYQIHGHQIKDPEKCWCWLGFCTEKIVENWCIGG